MNQSPMRNILVVAKREFSAYFTTPVAYVFLVIFLLLAGFFTFMVGRISFLAMKLRSVPFSYGTRGSTFS